MTNPDRLTGLDASFLALEDAGAYMHVGSCLLFEGKAPGYVEFLEQLDSRLHLVPRYRQKLAFPPLTQARPVWIDDPHFNPGYHVRHTALPAPASLEQLRNLTGRVLAQRLDRTKPLWEIWLVDEVEGGRFAMITKTHHCLVDGVSGVDIATVLFDVEAEPAAPPEAPPPWFPRPEPSSATLVADALAERMSTPLDAARLAADAFAHPEKAAGKLGKAAYGLGAMLRAGLQGAPPSPYNVTIGPHRRFAWADGDLAQFKAIKDALGGSVNDVVLAAVDGRAAHPHAGQRPRGRRHRAEGDGARCRSAPRPSAARSATASRRCSRRCRSTPTTPWSGSRSSTRRCRGSRSPARPSAPRC